MKKHIFSPGVVRWMKFNLVGAIGIAVQLLLIAVLTAVFRMNYIPATGLAVEATVLHNFVWHERYTWAKRGSRGWAAVSSRLISFNITTGAVSIGGNLLLMRLLVGEWRMPSLLANLASIAACSVLNFAASDRWVFQPTSRFEARATPRTRPSYSPQVTVEPEKARPLI
jgi:putative flippase GtrA